MSDEEDRIIAYDELTEFTFIDYLQLMAWYRMREEKFPSKAKLIVLKGEPHEPNEWSKYAEHYENPTQLSGNTDHQATGHDGAADSGGVNTEPSAADTESHPGDYDGIERTD